MSTNTSQRAKILTIGCKVNRYESASLEETLAGHGYTIVNAGEVADLVVVNTCTVTHRSDSDARAMIRRAIRENPGARIVAAGCYAKLEPETLAALGVDLVVGNAEKPRLAGMILAGESGVKVNRSADPTILEPEPVTRFGERSRAFFKVQDGCEAFCSYCIVPHARGPSRSLAPAEVEKGLARLLTGGHREVVLTGVHLGLWGRDLSPPGTFIELLRIAEKSAFNRVRVSSLEPLEVTEEFLSVMAASDKLCPHLHIPLQSGSDRILKLMGRPYTGASFLERMEMAAAKMNDICLGFDVIVGFPGETEEDFEQTVALLEKIDLCYLHVFPFSPRSGTPAYDMDGQVDQPTIKRRAATLRALSTEKKSAFYARMDGGGGLALAESQVVVDGTRYTKARLRNYVEVLVEHSDSLTGVEFPVTLLRWDGKYLTGKVGGSK